MGNDVHIAAGPIEVGKNKGRLKLWHIIHIAALLFRLPAQHVHQLMFHHEIKKFCRLWG